MDREFLIGAAEPDGKPDLAELVRDLTEVLGFELAELPDQEMFHGGDDTGHAWLKPGWRDPDEPYPSHPYQLDIAYPSGPELPYLNGLFDRLHALGRYRLIMLINGDCVRSTHFPCDEW
ncbi:hypothetical protein [Actinoplanes regularis]|uniref:Immunity protein 7 n=1 Tax=Actinoplanes regularis TaxID=52697 RepID=A0A239IMB4_9ACTN|nr:hypothetical protein [Actinoplanes regularis]GIE91435.1 hypothetical protein Are01nite_79150 [Actinoplanes regularis]SNS94737.1 hypothetical protein SAMN06264365_13024 [Actinoplanes regularis]